MVPAVYTTSLSSEFRIVRTLAVDKSFKYGSVHIDSTILAFLFLISHHIPIVLTLSSLQHSKYRIIISLHLPTKWTSFNMTLL